MAVKISRQVVIDLVRVTETAARAASEHQGRGHKELLDGAAVDAMRAMLNEMDIHACVVIGEGEKDQAPMLYEGEIVGSQHGRKHGVKLDIAVDPVDGTTVASKGMENAISVIAIAEQGGFLQAPDAFYMDKIACGPDIDPATISLDMPIPEILTRVAAQKNIDVSEVVVCVLERPRHDQLITDIRTAGARVRLIRDGDIAGAIATAMPDSGVDLMLGRGGSPEGVIAAAALKCLGGHILGRLHFNDAAAKKRAKQLGFDDPDKVFTTEEMASGEVMFAATGVTDGTLLKGVRHTSIGVYTHSVVMRSKTGTVRYVEAYKR